MRGKKEHGAMVAKRDEEYCTSRGEAQARAELFIIDEDDKA